MARSCGLTLYVLPIIFKMSYNPDFDSFKKTKGLKPFIYKGLRAFFDVKKMRIIFID